MTKSEVNQIYYLNKELETLKRELKKIQDKSNIGGQLISDEPRTSGGNGDKTANIATEIAYYKDCIDDLIYDIIIQKNKIMVFISNIDDSYLRQLVFLRAICCLTWSAVAQELGGDNTEDSVRMAYNRLFDKNM